VVLKIQVLFCHVMPPCSFVES